MLGMEDPRKYILTQAPILHQTTIDRVQTIGCKANQESIIPSTNGRNCGMVQQDIKGSLEKKSYMEMDESGKNIYPMFYLLIVQYRRNQWDSVHLNASLDEMFDDLSIYGKRTIKQCRGTGR